MNITCLIVSWLAFKSDLVVRFHSSYIYRNIVCSVYVDLHEIYASMEKDKKTGMWNWVGYITRLKILSVLVIKSM